MIAVYRHSYCGGNATDPTTVPARPAWHAGERYQRGWATRSYWENQG